jgi:hypothetical protein
MAKIEFPYKFEINSGDQEKYIYGMLEVEADIEIKDGYWGTKVDDIADWNPAELKSLEISSAFFITEDDTNEVDIYSIYEDVSEYISDNIDDFID